MANDTTISIGLSPEEVIASLKMIADKTRELSSVMEQELGKKASAAVGDLKDNAEKGTNQITKFFSNMSTRIREDLKTAWDATGVLAGAKFARTIGEGVKSVFDMERAFDRLNVRMGLSVRQMEDFKRTAGRATSEAGVNIKDIQSGLLSAASRGGVRDPKEMTAIAGALAQAKQVSPDMDPGRMADDVNEILKRQGIKMTGSSFRQTMDAISGATNAGGFRSSSETAGAIKDLSQFSATNGMSTRSLAGLATVASKGGESGLGLLNQILAKGATTGGQDIINGTLGPGVFKNGKLDPAALARVNVNKFGAASILGDATGLGGASGGDIKLLVESFRQNMGAFDAVAKGTGETADSFKRATQSWAAQLELFKTRIANTGLEIGEGLGEVLQGIKQGALTKEGLSSIGSGIADTASTAWDNKGDLAVAGVAGVGAALLGGGGLRGLMGSAAASATGTQKVYVTNAAEIAGGGMLDKLGLGGLGKKASGFLTGMAADAMILGGSSMGTIAGLGAGAMATAALGVGAAGAAGVGAGYLINKATGNDKGDIGGMLYDYLNKDKSGESEQMKKAFLEALTEHSRGRPVSMINPSSVKGQHTPARVGP